MMQFITQASPERICPVCGSSSQVPFADERIDPRRVSDFTYSSRKLPEFMCLRLVRCPVCDLVYTPTPPANDFLLTAYSEAAYDSGPEALAAARSYANAMTPYLTGLARRNAAVDVGAGSGPLLPLLIESGFSPVIGIEPSRAAIEAAPSAVRPLLRQGMFSPALLADLKSSLICSFMTLELADPGAFIGTALELLEPGGMLAVVTHNWRAPLNRLLGLRSPIIDVEHLQLFSPQSMIWVLKKSGLVSINLQSICNTYPLRYWLRLTPVPAKVKVRVTGALDSIGLSDIQISLRAGNMLAIGIKPLKDDNASRP